MRNCSKLCLSIFVLVGYAISFVSCGQQQNSASRLNGGRAKLALEENKKFPIRPHTEITPGALCSRADEHRYPERIKYCDRDVDSQTKAQIFVTYDREYGYHTREMDRAQFKIDHLIPLCMGGSNSVDNLWPQHQSVYEHTDPIEPMLCSLMSEGKLKQEKAVEIIKDVKQNPETAEQRLSEL